MPITVKLTDLKSVILKIRKVIDMLAKMVLRMKDLCATDSLTMAQQLYKAIVAVKLI